MSYIVTKRPGKPAEVVEQDKHIDYAQLKDALDHCTFTMTQVGVGAHTVDVFCDDEGLLKELELNFYHRQYDQPIVGPVLCCLSNDEGESVPMDKDLAEATAKLLDDWASTVPMAVLLGLM